MKRRFHKLVSSIPIERFCIVVIYNISLGRSLAKEHFGTWTTREEVEGVRKDVLAGRSCLWLAEGAKVVDCQISSVFILPHSLGRELGNKMVCVIEKMEGPYMGI